MPLVPDIMLLADLIEQRLATPKALHTISDNELSGARTDDDALDERDATRSVVTRSMPDLPRTFPQE